MEARLGLAATALVAFLLRVSVFTEGDTTGAWTSVLVFWFAVAGLLVLALVDAQVAWRGGDRTPLVRASLLTTCVAAILVGGFSDNESVEAIAVPVFSLTLIALIVLAAKRLMSRPS